MLGLEVRFKARQFSESKVGFKHQVVVVIVDQGKVAHTRLAGLFPRQTAMLQKKREMTKCIAPGPKSLYTSSIELAFLFTYLLLGQVVECLSVVQRGIGIDWLEGVEVELTRRLTAAQVTAAQANWSLLGLTQVQGGLGLLWESQGYMGA